MADDLQRQLGVPLDADAASLRAALLASGSRLHQATELLDAFQHRDRQHAERLGRAEVRDAQAMRVADIGADAGAAGRGRAR